MATARLLPVFAPAACGAAVPTWVNGGLTDNPSECTGLRYGTHAWIADRLVHRPREALAHHGHV
jgi:hypothetical protein